ncbi:MAG: hypothetical protein ABF608_06030 [Sporolactobacillus sp.]
MIKRKDYFIFAGMIGILIIAFILYTFVLGFRASTVNSGLPIPRSATVTKVDEKHDAEFYHWSSASEENGLPGPYMVALKMWGWHKEGQSGALNLYEKGSQVVEILSFTHRIVIGKGYKSEINHLP